jgi:hypothetical protein
MIIPVPPDLGCGRSVWLVDEFIYECFSPASHELGCSSASLSTPFEGGVIGVVTRLALHLPGLPHWPGNHVSREHMLLISAAALILTTLSGGVALCCSLPRLLHALLATGGAPFHTIMGLTRPAWFVFPVADEDGYESVH